MNRETPSAGRTIAISDLHGCATALADLLAQIEPASGDTIVTLGDYVNRGPDTRGVFEQLLDLAECCTLVPLLGNHDAALLDAYERRDREGTLDRPSRQATLRSYGPRATWDDVPRRHWQFLRDCRLWHESATHLFAHANYDAARPLHQTDAETLVWQRLEPPYPGPHCSGKRVIVGHTAQRSYQVLDLGHVVCIDTGCCYGGWLTAIDVDRNTYWQASEPGMRPPG